VSPAASDAQTSGPVAAQPAALAPLKSKTLATLSGIIHGFFGRAGGVSQAPFDSLNTGFGADDERANVLENRARCARFLGAEPDRLLTVHQIHSPGVVTVDRPWLGDPPEADGLVTSRPGLALGALAADCMPFLFVDPQAHIIGAAHAGWPGALAGVLEATVEAMTGLGAEPARIHAALGPCLRQPNFEVGLDLVARFEEKFGAEKIMPFFAPGRAPHKRQFDLAGFGRARLRAVGVRHLDDLDVCTRAQHGTFFSYRHSRQTGQRDYGRNLSAIMLTG